MEERELDDLCALEARLLHSFRVILAVPPPVKLASKAAVAHQAQGAWMGQAWLFGAGGGGSHTVLGRNPSPGPCLWKTSIYQATSRLCLLAGPSEKC